MDTHVYIDGFNLYYGLLKGTPHKWLDLERFCDQLLPKNTIRKIYYFTARLDARPQDPGQPTRQLAYLQALSTLPRVEVHCLRAPQGPAGSRRSQEFSALSP